MRRVFALSIAAIPPVPVTANAALRVVGYFEPGGDEKKILYQYLTCINFSFILPTADGGMTGLSASDLKKLDHIVANAHNAGVQVFISIGGWNNGDTSGFRAVSSDAEPRARFIGDWI